MRTGRPPTHGETRSVEYRTWVEMRRRCSPTSKDAANYYSRGIRVCSRWSRFESFLADMGRRPGPGFSVDRIDNEAGYEPGNCRWATVLEQSSNKRTSRLVTARGETLTVAEWARRVGVTRAAIRARLERGWPAEMAVTLKPDPRRRIDK